MASSRRGGKYEGAFIPRATGEAQRSEGMQLDLAQSQLKAAIGNLENLRWTDANLRKEYARIRDQMVRASVILEAIEREVQAGRHKNPGALVLYGNPPTVRAGDTIAVKVGPVLGVVESLDYDRTQAPTGLYFHDFGRNDVLCVGTLGDGQRIVLIANKRGGPLWGER